jgi:S1 RNA binding domain protein
VRKGVFELSSSDSAPGSIRESVGNGAPIEVGSTVEGTVVKLAEYGAIVRLQGGRTGLVHISEIADTFVRDVKDYFKEQDRVKVKVLSINNKGRYELSAKNIDQPVSEPTLPRERKKPVERPPDAVNLGPDLGGPTVSAAGNYGNFEDRLSHFLKDSQERQTDLKRNIESKRGIARKR